MRYACHTLLIGALLLNVAITANAQALSAQAGHAAAAQSTAPETTGPSITASQVSAAQGSAAQVSALPISAPRITAPFIDEISRLPGLALPGYSKPVSKPANLANATMDHTSQILRLNQDFRQRQAERARREGPASRSPGFTLVGEQPLPLPIIVLALGIAAAQKWVDPDTADAASAVKNTFSGFSDRIGVAGGSQGTLSGTSLQ